MRKDQQIHNLTREDLVDAMKRSGGSQRRMAHILGIPRTTLRLYLARWGLSHRMDVMRLTAHKRAFTARYG